MNPPNLKATCCFKLVASLGSSVQENANPKNLMVKFSASLRETTVELILSTLKIRGLSSFSY
jgi:hypothetical protein